MSLRADEHGEVLLVGLQPMSHLAMLAAQARPWTERPSGATSTRLPARSGRVGGTEAMGLGERYPGLRELMFGSVDGWLVGEVVHQVGRPRVECLLEVRGLPAPAWFPDDAVPE